MKIRKAKITDVREMHRLLNFYADRRELLPRALSELYENLQSFYVAEQQGKLIGCCSLQVTWDNLAEVKALAVDTQYQGKGLGTQLLKACLKEAKALGIPRVFTLAIRTGFFEKVGFRAVQKKEHFPHKVWTECIRCPYYPEKCIETAMVLDLGPKRKAVVPAAVTPTDLPMAVIVPSEPTTT
ncbi:MAG: N-acetyltransferase [Elusimicrobia bacterium]|nr:N-acetyltransferase [Elusimicrobiota bacterium]